MRLTISLLLLGFLVLPVLAKDAPAPTVYALGDKVADFRGPGLDGNPVTLSSLAIDDEIARAAALEVAKARAGDANVELTTPLEELSALRDEDGEFDDDLKTEMIGALGIRFGLVATDDKVDEMTTVGDLAAWVLAAKDSPLAIILWSSGCDTCINFYNEKSNEIIGMEHARMLVIASHPYDSAKLITERLDGFPFYWKVVLDQKQDIKKLFVEGATRTPHVFLLDKDGVLRYRGSVDSDPTVPTGDEELEDYMRDAIRAITAGEEVKITETQPKGCPLKLVK